MALAPNLPGSPYTQEEVDTYIAIGPRGGDTWYDLLTFLHPSGLAEVPIWYVTIVNAAVQKGRITAAQRLSLLTADEQGGPVAPPQSILDAWAALMQSMAITWPNRRNHASAQLLRMNTAVAKAQRRFVRG